MSMGRMSWEGPEISWGSLYASLDWWQHVLESLWANDQDIAETCGPAYLMWQDMKDFGSEVDFFSRPSLTVSIP